VDYDLDELRRLQELSAQQLATARRRVSEIEADGAELSFEATSHRGEVTVRVSSTGVVTDISLASGFGDPGKPTWMLADDIDNVSRAIVEAVSRARAKAAEEMRGRFAQAFPEAYELLDDLRGPAAERGAV